MKINMFTIFFLLLFCLIFLAEANGFHTTKDVLTYSEFVDLLDSKNLDISPPECYHNCRVNREKQFPCEELRTTKHAKYENCYECKPKGLYAKSRKILYKL
jgi:hypothetical protein